MYVSSPTPPSHVTKSEVSSTDSTVPLARSSLPAVHFRRIVRVPDSSRGGPRATLPPGGDEC
ncbi:hypothetical protein, partial [Streptomyces sp. NPDC058964]|uniref:hypothetical protein n=1 Tax=Streptomyces sp. NPDC058964 TaxID=3346681 RepID=UPI00368F1147